MPLKRKQSVLSCLITRSVDDNARLKKELGSPKWRVISWPSYRYQALPVSAKTAKAVRNIALFDWIVLTSTRAVDAFFVVYFETHRDVQALKGIKFAAVGAQTAAALKSYGVRVNLIPQDNSVAGLIAAKPFQSSTQLKILFPCARDARPDFVKAFHNKHDIVVAKLYCKKLIQHSAKDREALLQKKIDWVLFYSPSAVDAFLKGVGVARGKKWLSSIKIATIGKTTAAHLQTLSLNVVVVADKAETKSLIQKILVR